MRMEELEDKEYSIEEIEKLLIKCEEAIEMGGAKELKVFAIKICSRLMVEYICDEEYEMAQEVAKNGKRWCAEIDRTFSEEDQRTASDARCSFDKVLGVNNANTSNSNNRSKNSKWLVFGVIFMISFIASKSGYVLLAGLVCIAVYFMKGKSK